MKAKQIVGLLLVVSGLFLAGCTNINSGNVGGNIHPPKYGPNERAVVVKDKNYTYDISGRLVSSHEVEDKTGLAVADGIIHHKTDMAEKVGVAKAGGGANGFWARAFGPTTTTVGGYGYYGSSQITTGANGNGTGQLGGTITTAGPSFSAPTYQGGTGTGAVGGAITH